MHRDLQDDEGWAQGAMLRICTVIACLLLVYVTQMLFMQVDVAFLGQTREKQRSLTCMPDEYPMSMP